MEWSLYCVQNIDKKLSYIRFLRYTNNIVTLGLNIETFRIIRMQMNYKSLYRNCENSTLYRRVGFINIFFISLGQIRKSSLVSNVAWQASPAY